MCVCVCVYVCVCLSFLCGLGFGISSEARRQKPFLDASGLICFCFVCSEARSLRSAVRIRTTTKKAKQLVQSLQSLHLCIFAIYCKHALVPSPETFPGRLFDFASLLPNPLHSPHNPLCEANPPPPPFWNYPLPPLASKSGSLKSHPPQRHSL